MTCYFVTKAFVKICVRQNQMRGSFKIFAVFANIRIYFCINRKTKVIFAKMEMFGRFLNKKKFPGKGNVTKFRKNYKKHFRFNPSSDRPKLAALQYIIVKGNTTSHCNLFEILQRM